MVTANEGPNECQFCGADLLTHDISDDYLPRSSYQYEAKGYELDANRILFVEHTGTRCRAARTPKNTPI